MVRLEITLRQETDDDLAWLRELHDATRDDVRFAPWPDAVKAQFLAEQFRLRQAHYATMHPLADRLMVNIAAAPAGRLFVDRTAAPWRLVDLAVDRLYRGRGIGTALVRWLQRQGKRAGIELHVARDNPRAAALYARLGFGTAIDGTASHVRMTWRELRPGIASR